MEQHEAADREAGISRYFASGCDIAAARIAAAAGKREDSTKALEALLLKDPSGFLGCSSISGWSSAILKRGRRNAARRSPAVALEREAAAKGFGLVARKAAAARYLNDAMPHRCSAGV